jgi:hypothetical protein
MNSRNMSGHISLFLCSPTYIMEHFPHFRPVRGFGVCGLKRNLCFVSRFQEAILRPKKVCGKKNVRNTPLYGVMQAALFLRSGVRGRADELVREKFPRINTSTW